MNAPLKSHATFNPTLNALLIVVNIAFAVTLMALCRPPVPIAFPILGAILGSVGGFLQHIRLKRDYNRFGAASSLLEIRRRLAATRTGKLYFYYFWCYIFGMVLLTFAINKSPITAVAAFIVAYLLFAAVRELITLRDVFAMRKRAL